MSPKQLIGSFVLLQVLLVLVVFLLLVSYRADIANWLLAENVVYQELQGNDSATAGSERSYLGVRFITINDNMVGLKNLPVVYGALVVRDHTKDSLAVVPGSPAEKAGITEDDIILAVDGEELRDGKTLTETIHQKSAGDTVTLTLLREGEEVIVRITLGSAPNT